MRTRRTHNWQTNLRLITQTLVALTGLITALATALQAFGPSL